jgi:nucleoside phosphorylase
VIASRRSRHRARGVDRKFIAVDMEAAGFAHAGSCVEGNRAAGVANC